MSQTIQTPMPTAKERLAVIETLMNAMVESNMKFETAMMEAIRRVEANQKEIDSKLNAHLQEPFVTYKDTKKKIIYEVVRYVVLILVGAVIAYVVETIGGN